MTRPPRVRTTPSLTPTVLMEAPELAALAMLRRILDITVQALLAVHPDLLDAHWPDPQEPPTAQSWIAHLILTHVHLLQQDLDRYDQVPPHALERRLKRPPLGDDGMR
jgi:hypothetical protein